jgi:hypothetical protein
MGILRTPLFQMQAVSPARFVPRSAGRKKDSANGLGAAPRGALLLNSVQPALAPCFRTAERIANVRQQTSGE